MYAIKLNIAGNVKIVWSITTPFYIVYLFTLRTLSITRVAILKTSFYHTKIACSFIDAAYLKYKTFELRKLHIWHLLLSSLGINCLLQRVFEVVESNK